VRVARSQSGSCIEVFPAEGVIAKVRLWYLHMFPRGSGVRACVSDDTVNALAGCRGLHTSGLAAKELALRYIAF
jgi:hypothetical protein